MNFNFDETVDRNNTNSIKWSAAPSEDVLPMWVADMDFKTAPAIIEALQNRVSHGVFGYTQTQPEFYSAITNWWERRHGFILEKEWIVPATGVIPALSATVRALTQNGDKVLLQPPVYNHFYITLQNCGCEIAENNLVYNNGDYTIDFDDLENKAVDPLVKMLILSNPHNPVGRVWTKEELQRIGDICLKNDVIVISDEIHSDLVFFGFKHISFASLGKEYSKNSVTLSSPTKTFNLAGLQVGYLFTENKEFKQAIQKILTLQEMELLSPFAITTLIAAYNEGEAWLEALKSYLHDNYLLLKDYIATHFPEVTVTPLQATYLVWLDCSALKKPSAQIAKQLLKEHKLWLNPGTMYGDAGEGFLRVNIACPRKLLNEGLDRLLQGLTEA
jgi:cystathionine beta-lyase